METLLKILVADPIHKIGIQFLQQQPDIEVIVPSQRLTKETLIDLIDDVEGVIIRSESQINEDVILAAKKLRVIGRAGVGTDNVNIPAATNNGIAVVNAPTGNIIAAAEHTIAMMLASARQIPKADASLKKQLWNRSQFMGIQIQNKTLGIIGLGRVGTEVARMAIGLKMKVIGYDPFVTEERAIRLGVELVEFEQLLSNSDFLTIHTPLTDSSRYLIGKTEIEKLKPNATIINVARGGLIDEIALLAALDEHRLSAAAIDVFREEPPTDYTLAQHLNVIATPHLGASTNEAQSDVAIEVAEQVLAVLRGQSASNTLNAPFSSREGDEDIAPYMQVAATLGKVAIQLVSGQIRNIAIEYTGNIANSNTDGIKAATLVGLLQNITDTRVSLVNALLLAEQRGLNITETHNSSTSEYTNLITIRINTDTGTVVLAGSNVRGNTHIMRVNDYRFDTTIESPHLLFVENIDRPGVIGGIGAIVGKADINISFMVLGRLAPRGHAMMILGIDEFITPTTRKELEQFPDIINIQAVSL
jgi:D-3-phosphoglycerate dehydrogenase